MVVALPARRWVSAERGPATVLAVSAATDPGAVRVLNEDAYLVAPPVFAVADGMGGHAAGDVASAAVVRSLAGLADRRDLAPADLAEALELSRRELGGLDVPEGGSSPGSTVVAAVLVTQDDRDYWLIAHEGDSRAYLWRAGRLEQVTRDHSLVQEMVDAGEIAARDAATHPERHVITRAVGATIDTEPEFTLVPLESGSRLVLCTDGLTTELSTESIGVLLAEHLSCAAAVGALVGAACAAGGHDNVTVVVVDVEQTTTDHLADATLPGGVGR